MARKKQMRGTAGTFKDLVAEATAHSARHPKDGQGAARVTNDGVWDETGAYWPASDGYLRREQVEVLLDDPDLHIGVQAGFGRDPEFFPTAAARRVWIERIEAHFADDGDIEAAGWPDDVAYSAELRRRPDGSRLLWFGGQC